MVSCGSGGLVVAHVGRRLLLGRTPRQWPCLAITETRDLSADVKQEISLADVSVLKSKGDAAGILSELDIGELVFLVFGGWMLGMVACYCRICQG